MALSDLKFIPGFLLNDYKSQISDNNLAQYVTLQDSELSLTTFSFYTSVAAVYSSKIEGEEIELDSYVKHKRFGIEFLPDYTRKIDDLYDAYQFAKKNKCNKKNIETVHWILTKHILPESRRGTIRTSLMYVTTPDGKIEYVAAAPAEVSRELEKFYTDLDYLLSENLSLQELFCFASFVHLIFVKIHPFDDGNGRTARLIEKWFWRKNWEKKPG
jgi:Fic family protein